MSVHPQHKTLKIHENYHFKKKCLLFPDISGLLWRRVTYLKPE